MFYGYSEVDADRFIDGVEREKRATAEYDSAVHGRPFLNVIFGSGIFLLGIASVIMLFSFGSGPRGAIVSLSLLGLGAFTFLRGLSRLNHW